MFDLLQQKNQCKVLLFKLQLLIHPEIKLTYHFKFIMTIQQEIGQKGEQIALAYLKKLGYQILETNWHFHHYEIDIIALDANELVIVEVKARTGTAFEHPSEAVGKRKMKFLIDAAEAYIFKINSHRDTRFDVVTIIFQGDQYDLEHYKDAFYPTA